MNSHYCCNNWTFLFRIVFYQFSSLPVSLEFILKILNRKQIFIYGLFIQGFLFLLLMRMKNPSVFLIFYNYCLFYTGNTFCCFWQYYPGLYRLQISCHYLVRCFYAAHLHHCFVLWNYGKGIWSDFSWIFLFGTCCYYTDFCGVVNYCLFYTKWFNFSFWQKVLIRTTGLAGGLFTPYKGFFPALESKDSSKWFVSRNVIWSYS